MAHTLPKPHLPMNLQRDRSAWLHGPDDVCQVQPIHPPQARRYILLGAPGIGKGTQAALLSAALGACHLSTGDIFRHVRHGNRDSNSPSLSAACAAMQRGELVSDEVVLRIVRERIACLSCRGGFLLDGFPRTVPQAAALDVLLGYEGVKLDAVISYELDEASIIARIGGRRTCPVCKLIYHATSRPPRAAGYCDTCGSALLQREDDRPEAVHIRQLAYEKNTTPLLAHYAAQDLLVRVDARGTPEEVFTRTLGALEKPRR